MEAYADCFPSRGTKELAGDSWISMDASFKQYDFSEGMNLKKQIPFDTQAFGNALESKATINQEEGWIQNVPRTDIETQVNQAQNQLKTFIENQNPNATVGDVLGLQKIKALP